MERMSTKKHIVFHYFLREIQLYLFDSFGIEYIPQEVLKKIKDKYITHNMFRVQAFIEYMLAGKTLLDDTNLFLTNDYKNDDKITYNYFKDK